MGRARSSHVSLSADCIECPVSRTSGKPSKRQTTTGQSINEATPPSYHAQLSTSHCVLSKPKAHFSVLPEASYNYS